MSTITNFNVRIWRSERTSDWELAVTLTRRMGGSPTINNQIDHDRTRRTYPSAEDACTSTRHLIKELVKLHESSPSAS